MKQTLILIGLLISSDNLMALNRETVTPMERLPKANMVDTKLSLCFSPHDPCDQRLLREVEKARTTLDVAVYDINLRDLVNLLIKKSKEMRVRVVVDQRQAKGDHSLVRDLISGGVQVRFGKQRGIFHHKFIVIDGTSVETGSFNFTNHAAKANQENQVYIKDARTAGEFGQKFAEIWSNARPARQGDLVPKSKGSWYQRLMH